MRHTAAPPTLPPVLPRGPTHVLQYGFPPGTPRVGGFSRSMVEATPRARPHSLLRSMLASPRRGPAPVPWGHGRVTRKRARGDRWPTVVGLVTDRHPACLAGPLGRPAYRGLHEHEPVTVHTPTTGPTRRAPQQQDLAAAEGPGRARHAVRGRSASRGPGSGEGRRFGHLEGALWTRPHRRGRASEGSSLEDYDIRPAGREEDRLP